MTLIQIINTILVLVLGPEVVACCWILCWLIQRMPAEQRTELEQFSRMAVRHVMQQPEQLAKREMAKLHVIDLFKEYKSPVPSNETLEKAISSAMYELEQHG